MMYVMASSVMTDNLILEKISHLEVGVAVSYIIAAVALIVLLYRAYRRSNTTLSAWYKAKEQKQVERAMIYETAKDLAELTKRHEDDITKLNARFDEVLSKINTLSDAIEKQKELTNKNKQRELRNEIIAMYDKYTADDGRAQWNDDIAQEFWELVDLYEGFGGNGYVHEVIVPTMRNLPMATK